MVSGISSNLGNFYQQQGLSTQLQSAGIPTDIISKGQSAIEDYAKQNNITLPKPPQPKDGESIFTQNKKTQSNNGMQAKHADPSIQGDNSEAPDITSELSSLGIPADVIAQGQQAVTQYAQENNISLPKPPEKPNVDSPQQLNMIA